MTMTTAAPWPVTALPFRVHTADGSKAGLSDEADARVIAAQVSSDTGGPVAVERWDSARQQWVLVELVTPQGS